MKLQNMNVRIKRLEFMNFRNIESGAVDFPNADAKDFYDGKSSILGLYGQNGSGKSTVIMALSILKDVLSGKRISEKYISCVRVGCERCTLGFTFSTFAKLLDENNIVIQNDYFKEVTEFYYNFDIVKRSYKSVNEYGKQEETISLAVENEILWGRRKGYSGEIRASKRILFDTRKSSSDDKGMAFGSKVYYKLLTLCFDKRIKELNEISRNLSNQYRELKLTSREYGTSFLFSNKFSDLIDDGTSFLLDNKLCNLVYETIFDMLKDYVSDYEFPNIDNLFDNYVEYTSNEQKYSKRNEKEMLTNAFTNSDEESLIKYLLFTISTVLSPITILQNFGCYYLQVVDTVTTGITNTNTHLPLLLWNRDKQRVFVYKFSLLMDMPTTVPEKNYLKTIKALKAVSDVLSKMVPGTSLDVQDLGKILTIDNEKEHCFEILSRHNDHVMPLRFESDGIRRIVSILSLLIAVYNEESFTVAIDEIDSGIFEYMLGELLSIMSESIKGQFIFTSHNLRPLEVLPSKFLCFTTVNPTNRFTTLPHRGNSNMRDTYFRNIVLGSNNNKESIYNSTDKYEIERALYKAGHLEDEEL